MAKIIENPKGFKVIEVSLIETINWGGLGICDLCNEPYSNAFYIAVLNSCYCNDCYNGFNKRSVYYPEDAKIEERNFQYYKKQLSI